MSTNSTLYEGFVIIDLFPRGTTIENPGPNVNRTFDLFNEYLKDRPISWVKSPPPGFENITLPDLTQTAFWKSSSPVSQVLTTVDISGSQAGCGNVTTTITVSDTFIPYKNVLGIENSSGCSTTSYRKWTGSGSTVINRLGGKFANFQMPVFASFNNQPSISTPNAYNVYFSLYLNVQFYVSCVGAFVDTPTCAAICSQSDKLTSCIQPYVDYCAADIPNRLVKSKNCQTFFQEVISKQGDVPPLDAPLRKYCADTFGTFEALTTMTAGNVDDVNYDICACHMPASQYQKLQAQIDSQFPQISSFYDQKELCYFPGCVSSRYPPVEIARGCNIPQCLIINEFVNTGEFTGNVTFTSSCTNNKVIDIPDWLIIIIALIVIVLAIVVYYVY